LIGVFHLVADTELVESRPLPVSEKTSNDVSTMVSELAFDDAGTDLTEGGTDWPEAATAVTSRAKSS